jgi:hypothetical protein
VIKLIHSRKCTHSCLAPACFRSALSKFQFSISCSAQHNDGKSDTGEKLSQGEIALSLQRAWLLRANFPIVPVLLGWLLSSLPSLSLSLSFFLHLLHPLTILLPLHPSCSLPPSSSSLLIFRLLESAHLCLVILTFTIHLYFL